MPRVIAILVYGGVGTGMVCSLLLTLIAQGAEEVKQARLTRRVATIFVATLLLLRVCGLA